DIDRLLISMREGSEYNDEAGNSYKIPDITTASEVAALEEAQQDWNKLKPLITAYLKGASDIRVDSSDELALAYEQAKTSSLRMNDALDKLTSEVYKETERQANTIRLIQILGVAAIFAYFL